MCNPANDIIIIRDLQFLLSPLLLSRFSLTSFPQVFSIRCSTSIHYRRGGGRDLLSSSIKTNIKWGRPSQRSASSLSADGLHSSWIQATSPRKQGLALERGFHEGREKKEKEMGRLPVRSHSPYGWPLPLSIEAAIIYLSLLVEGRKDRWTLKRQEHKNRDGWKMTVLISAFSPYRTITLEKEDKPRLDMSDNTARAPDDVRPCTTGCGFFG